MERQAFEKGKTGAHQASEDTEHPLIAMINADIQKASSSNKIVIACGSTHALAIGSGNSLYGWGSNQFSQLAENSAEPSFNHPIEIEMVGQVWLEALQVSCGVKHSAVLARPHDDRERNQYPNPLVFTFGSPENGRLGRPLEENEKEDAKDNYQTLFKVCNPVTALENKFIKMVACGSSFTLALTQEGEVYSWGEGSSGALGTGYYDDVWEPRLIAFDYKKGKLPPMRFIAAGYAHSVGITNTGQMYSWGSGEMGQLGISTPQNVTVPTLAVMPRIKIEMAACGMYNTMVVTEDQLLFGCGANKNGQLGFPDLTNREKLEEVTFFSSEPICWVACGANHTLVLTLAHKVFAFGNNNHYKCGIINPQEIGKNITVPTEVTFPLVANDYIYQLAASLNLSLAISKGGQCFTWGKDVGGLLGRPSTFHKDVMKINEEGYHEDQYSPDEQEDVGPNPILDINFLKKDADSGDNDKLSVAIKDLKCGSAHTVALTNAGELFVWGSNEYGQHGLSTAEIERIYEARQELNKRKIAELPPECLPSQIRQFDIRVNKKVTFVATGHNHIIAVENFRKVYGWGRNLEGQLGVGYSCREVTEPTQIPDLTGYVIKEIVASEAHTLVLTELGELYAFGSPLYGRLGIGLASSLQVTPRKIKDIPRVVQISCGPTHSMALVVEETSDDRGAPTKEVVLYSWGSGWGGKLGHGNLDNYFAPTRVDTSVRFKQISCGYNHSAGISTRGKIFIWGPREYFGLVEKKASDIVGAYKVKPSDIDILKPTLFEHHIFGHFNFSHIALGNHYNVVLSENNVLYKWGLFENLYEEELQKIDDHTHLDQQLADLVRVEKHANILKTTFHSLPEMQDYIISVNCSSNHAVAFSQKYAYSWGLDSFTGRLGQTADIFDLDDEGQDNQGGLNRELKVKRLDNPKIIKFLSNIFNKNTQKLNIQKQVELMNETQSGKTKRSGRSKKSAESKMSRRTADKNKSRNSKASQVNTSSMTSLIEIEEEDEVRVLSSTKKFLEALKESEEKNRYQKLLLKTEAVEGKLQELYKKYKEFKVVSNKLGGFAKSAENVIITRFLSPPFNIKPSTKHALQLPEEFVKNQQVYRHLYTILQLHPCYLRNIFRTRKIPVKKLYKIIKEIFGEMEKDKRKIRLLIALSIEVLKEELKQKNPYTFNFDSLDDATNGTPLFTRLFKLLMKSDSQNIEYLDSVENKIRSYADIAQSNVSNKFMKPYALVFKGDEVQHIMNRYKNENEAFKFGEMERIVKRVKDTVDKLVDDISKTIFQGAQGNPMSHVIPGGLGMKEAAGHQDHKKKALSKDVKFLLKKCVEVTKDYFRDSDIILEQIQNKSLSLIFVPMREKIQKNKSAENFLNYMNLTDAFMMYIKGETFSSDSEKWVVELNNAILKADEKRRSLLSTFYIDGYDLQEKLMKSTFYHSMEFENDKIQCKLENIACLTVFLNENAETVAVIRPENLDFVVKFREKLNSKTNYLLSNPSAKDAKRIVNLKLKTRQLLYGEDSTMKICNSCGVYLKDVLSSTDSHPLINQLEKEDPRSLETYFKKFLKDLDEKRAETLLEASEEFETFAKKALENFKGRQDYEKVANVAIFMKVLEDELQLRFPYFKELYKSQEINAMKYNLLKELQVDLNIRLNNEIAFENEMDCLDELLDILLNDKLKDRLDHRNQDFENKKTIIDAIKYGNSIQSEKADKILSKNRQSIYSEVRGQLNGKSQCKDLVENLNDAEKRRLQLFGKYSLPILKIKNILVEFSDPKSIDIGKKKKQGDLKKYALVFTKNQDKYIFSLIYSTKKTTLMSLFFRSNKSNFEEYEEIIDEVTLTDKDLLKIRQLITKSNDKTTKVGKYLELNSKKFLELLDALNSNQEIYEQQILRKQGHAEVRNEFHDIPDS